MSKDAPNWLSHKPVITVDYEQTDAVGDAKFLSLGRSTWDKDCFSAKIWRKPDGTNRWSRQSEELPFWRVLDLATLLVATINNKQSNLEEFSQNSSSEKHLQNFINENMEILGPKMDELREMLKTSPTELASEGAPNIFSYATSELSQDAMFAWLIQWADPKNKEYDVTLNKVAKDFIKLLMNKDSKFTIESVKVKRQWKNVDIVAEINSNSFLLIEDKTGTTIHDNQLERYKETAEHEYKDREDKCYAYIKTNNEPESVLRKIRDAGYTTIDRGQILGCLNNYSGSNLILISYREQLQGIEDDTSSFKRLPYKKWGWYAWQGFYKYLEERLDIESWQYVSNPSGGFLGIWWHFSKISEGHMYLQIEQGKLCFKISCMGEEDHAAIRDKYHQALMKARGNDMKEIVRPDRFGSGTYMTIAIVRPEYLFGDGIVNLDDVVTKLKKYQEMIDKCCRSND